MKKVLYILYFTFFLSACTYKYDVPLNIENFTQGIFEISYKGEKNTLFVSKNEQTYYFLYQNILGIPLAKKSFFNGVFKNEGFFKPDKNLDKLFVKVLDFIKLKRKKDKIILKNGKVYEITKLSIF